MRKPQHLSVFVVLLIVPILLGVDGCDHKTSDSVQREQQELLLQEGTRQTGMPAIVNFRERKMLKDILELRDQAGLVTYTYTWSDYKGCATYFGESIGYGIPYATQYTNPQKVDWGSSHVWVLPQADPNGLFSPAAAEGTWVLMKDPNGDKVLPIYVEPRVIVSPFKLKNGVCPS